MNITKVNKSDYKALQDIWENSVRETHDFLKEEDIQFFKPLVLKEFAHTEYLLGTINEIGKWEAFLGVNGDKIEMLFVHPDARGKGLGKYLINYAKTELQIKHVDVNEQNTQAVGFYKHMGFEVFKRDELDGMGKPFPILHMKLKDE